MLPTESFSGLCGAPTGKTAVSDRRGILSPCGTSFQRTKKTESKNIFICTVWRGRNDRGGWRKIYAPCKPGLLHSTFRGHRYYASEKDPWSILWVHFKGTDTEYYPLEECRLINFNSQNATNRMQFLFELLFRVLESNYTLGNFIYISQVLEMILSETYYREKHNTTQEQNKHVTNVIRYMYKHLHENLTLEHVVEEFELSKSYLNAIFQKYTQHAPMDFFHIAKDETACQLLRASDCYIYEVAQRLHYTDQYYFSRIFKKVVGMSPKEYRESDWIHFKE